MIKSQDNKSSRQKYPWQHQRRSLLKGFGAIYLVSHFPRWAWSMELTAREVAELASQTDKVNTWTANNTITMKGGSSTTRTRQGWMANQLRDTGNKALRFFRFAEPADLAGTALLIHENNPDVDDLWLYLPAMGRARRIVSSGLKNSFIGTEFAYADLMTQQSDRFEHSFSHGDDVFEGEPAWIVDSVPADEDWAEDIGYARQRAWIRKSDYATLRVDYFNLRDQLFKRQIISQFYMADDVKGRFIACHRHMMNLDNGRETVMAFNQVAINQDVDRGYFRPERLGR